MAPLVASAAFTSGVGQFLLVAGVLAALCLAATTAVFLYKRGAEGRSDRAIALHAAQASRRLGVFGLSSLAGWPIALALIPVTILHPIGAGTGVVEELSLGVALIMLLIVISIVVPLRSIVAACDSYSSAGPVAEG